MLKLTRRETTVMTMGERIRAAREDAGITQEELGRACGVAKQTIFKYESGVITNIPIDKLERMAQLLGVSPAQLLGWETPPGTPAGVRETGTPTLEETVVGLMRYAEGGDAELSDLPPGPRERARAAYELAAAVGALPDLDREKLTRYARYLDGRGAGTGCDAPTTMDEFRFAEYLLECGAAPEEYETLPDPGYGLRTDKVARAHRFLALYDSLGDERRRLADEFLQLLAGSDAL